MVVVHLQIGMNLHEHQGKRILKRLNLMTPTSTLVCQNDSQLQLWFAKDGRLVVKSQLQTGKRGLSGGIIVTTKTGAKGRLQQLLGSLFRCDGGTESVSCVLVEEEVPILRELFVSLVASRAEKCVVLLLSQTGGMDVEDNSNSVSKVPTKILLSLEPNVVREIIKSWGVLHLMKCKLVVLVRRTFRLLLKVAALTIEINPLAVSRNDFVVLDTKISGASGDLLQENRLDCLQPLRPSTDYDATRFAVKHKMSFVQLDCKGTGCVVNGAGLAMATLDSIVSVGGRSSNFLDVSGKASVRRTKQALALVFQSCGVQMVLINIFGGIVSCATVAKGLLSYTKHQNNALRVTVRLEGTNEKIGVNVLLNSGIRTVLSVVSFVSSVTRALRTY